jgi:hypothetical protein
MADELPDLATDPHALRVGKKPDPDHPRLSSNGDVRLTVAGLASMILAEAKRLRAQDDVRIH